MPDRTYTKLLEGNQRFVEISTMHNPDFFKNLAEAQKPKVLWIGCADSRVPANQITGTLAGEIFVHRNIANVIVHTDMNSLSVIEYAVNVLEVEHIIVCGHYECGGVKAALSSAKHGLIDNWLCHIKDVYRLHSKELAALKSENEKWRRLVELNVIEQVANVCKTSIVQASWEKRNLPQIHGWVYELKNGFIKNLNVDIKGAKDLAQVYQFDPTAVVS